LHRYGLLRAAFRPEDSILNSLRKRANTFGFDLVELPKAA